MTMCRIYVSPEFNSVITLIVGNSTSMLHSLIQYADIKRALCKDVKWTKSVRRMSEIISLHQFKRK